MSEIRSTRGEVRTSYEVLISKPLVNKFKGFAEKNYENDFCEKHGVRK